LRIFDSSIPDSSAIFFLPALEAPFSRSASTDFIPADASFSE
jgi:hypothetical protein